MRIRRAEKAWELRKGERAVLLATKHGFFMPEVCRSFDAYASALPLRERNGLMAVDFAADPEAFNLCRKCLQLGARVEKREGEIWLYKDHRAMVLAAQHFVYSADMAERFELYFSPVVPEERDGLQIVDYSRPGKLQTYRMSGLQFELASFPEEDEAIEGYFKRYTPKAGDLVFDMGAHCGVSTYHFSKLVGPEGRVVAFEPDPLNCSLLKRNIERHGLKNVTVENSAVAGSAGKLAFNCEGTIGSSLVSQLHRDSVGSVVMVNAITLADAFERWGVPAFCKIDIEGSEVEVLAASKSLLREHPTNFALDTHHPKPNGEMTNGDVEAVFLDCGYGVSSEANPCWTTWAWPK